MADARKKLVKTYEVKRAGLEIVYDSHSQSFMRRSIKRILGQFGVHYGILLKTVIVVLEKPLNSAKYYENG